MALYLLKSSRTSAPLPSILLAVLLPGNQRAKLRLEWDVLLIQWLARPEMALMGAVISAWLVIVAKSNSRNWRASVNTDVSSALWLKRWKRLLRLIKCVTNSFIWVQHLVVSVSLVKTCYMMMTEHILVKCLLPTRRLVQEKLKNKVFPALLLSATHFSLG